jgi:ADP-heptose:LPS heptosyltransferase
LAALKKNLPQAQIDFATLQTYAPLLEGHPHIRHLYCVERDAGYKPLKALGKYFELKGYDLIIDLHNTLRSKIICSQLLHTPHVVYRKPRWKRFKLFQFHLNHFPDRSNQRQMYQETIKHLLKVDAELQPTSLRLSSVEIQKGRTLLAEHRVKGDYLVVLPGAAWKQKTWFKEYYQTLFTQIKAALSVNLVVLGGTTDTICAEISAGVAGTVDLHGLLGLRETLGVLAGARLVLGSDTGFVHAAEALGVPVVMILGPTSYETGGGTYLDNSVTLQAKDVWCRPCSQNGRRPCYRSLQVCMERITPDQVFHHVCQNLGVA